MENVSPSGGDVMQKRTVNRVRMKRTVWRNAHARVGLTNSHVPLATAYWYVTLLPDAQDMFQCFCTLGLVNLYGKTFLMHSFFH
jgi:hypothetical protein